MYSPRRTSHRRWPHADRDVRRVGAYRPKPSARGGHPPPGGRDHSLPERYQSRCGLPRSSLPSRNANRPKAPCRQPPPLRQELPPSYTNGDSRRPVLDNPLIREGAHERLHLDRTRPARPARSVVQPECRPVTKWSLRSSIGLRSTSSRPCSPARRSIPAGLRPAPAPALGGLRQRWSLPEVFDANHDKLSLDKNPSRWAAARPLRDRLPSGEVRSSVLTGTSTGTESGGGTRQHLLYSFKPQFALSQQLPYISTSMERVLVSIPHDASSGHGFGRCRTQGIQILYPHESLTDTWRIRIRRYAQLHT